MFPTIHSSRSAADIQYSRVKVEMQAVGPHFPAVCNSALPHFVGAYGPMKNEGTHGLVSVARRFCLRRTLPQQAQHCASTGDLHPTPMAFLLKPMWTAVSRCSFIGGFEKGYDEGAPETGLIDGSSWFYHSLLHRLRIPLAFCAQRHMHATELKRLARRKYQHRSTHFPACKYFGIGLHTHRNQVCSCECMWLTYTLLRPSVHNRKHFHASIRRTYERPAFTFLPARAIPNSSSRASSEECTGVTALAAHIVTSGRVRCCLNLLDSR